ncbi:DUF3408 domain-containing protein [uncultured Duncaniella sp.]|uniref:DUF3408 domain-containing protein n=1 Tax=uncultured Duncaniella sp. TaxID=2768039 RepID=UPI0025AA1FFA|nr:DUF3408 domain-containing protein [uncultured Duncaniella sp.]
MKTNKTTAPKSTELTDATKSKVSTLNPDFIMKSDNSTNPTNATTTVNSDNAVNDTSPANTDSLFDNEQTATDTTEQPKQQRVGKQQRKSDYAEFKAIYLTPAKLMKRHPVNIEDGVWTKLERIARILGDRDTTVGSYINAVLLEHLNLYADDIEIWRKL